MSSKSSLKVIGTLERFAGFASAQEIHNRLRKSGESIGLTSVYRALQALAQEKKVDYIRRSDGEAIYRLCGEGHHHHLICRKCGETVEIEGSTVEKWVNAQANENKFREISHNIEIFGLCKNC